MPDEYPPDFSEAEINALRRSAKEALRQRCASLRRALNADARRERSDAMAKLLLTLPEFQRAQVISAYLPLKFEVDPSLAIAQARAEGKVVTMPRVVPKARELALHVHMPGDELLESSFAVPEPLETAPLVALDTVDVVLVPGLGFDLRGHRLGYGQGFYDRLLPRLTRAVRVGVAFELSMLVEVPASSHDVPVDVIVTDKRVIRCER